jgi:hypothetical protein
MKVVGLENLVIILCHLVMVLVPLREKVVSFFLIHLVFGTSNIRLHGRKDCSYYSLYTTIGETNQHYEIEFGVFDIGFI